MPIFHVTHTTPQGGTATYSFDNIEDHAAQVRALTRLGHTVQVWSEDVVTTRKMDKESRRIRRRNLGALILFSILTVVLTYGMTWWFLIEWSNPR